MRMSVVDVFHIFSRGTVILGKLEGNGRLSVGDGVVCEGRHWRVRKIEERGAVIKTAEPGSSVGILLRKWPWGTVLRGMTVEFVPRVGARAAARARARPARGTAMKRNRRGRLEQ